MTERPMTDDYSEIEERIRAYLADHGGSVEDPGGRLITDDMAIAIAVDKPMLLSVVLAKMENDGEIAREMRGLRTYRIALATGDHLAQAAPNGTPPAAGNGADPGGASLGLSVSLREWTASQPALVEGPKSPDDGGVAPGGAEATEAEAVADGPVADEQVTREAAATPPELPAGKAMSLREALSGHPPKVDRGAASAGASGAVPESPAAAASGAVPADAVPESPADPVASPADAAPESPAPPMALPGMPLDEPSRKAMSLREALAARGAPGPDPADPAAGPNGDVPSAHDAPSPVSYARPTDVYARQADESERDGDKDSEPGPARPRRRPLSVPVPEVKAPPSTTILVLVGVALAALVLITVIAVAVTRRSNHHVPGQGTIDSSVDACHVVTPAEATAAFGKDAGVPHLVLGTCVYDDGTHELIVQVARQSARTLFNASHTNSAHDVPGIGDAAYYDHGRLWVLKGSTLMQMTLGPVPANSPTPKLLTLASSVVGRL